MRTGRGGMFDASLLQVEIIESSKPPRRWLKPRVIVVVSSLVAAVALLSVSVVGLTHSFGFAISAADAVGDVGVGVDPTLVGDLVGQIIKAGF
ncbi:MAG TPA: hypothetical protein VHP33_32185 [Polyangiaceae bacterium]|nr:hypothetical protein [Polyangiaceae bacterium]